MPAALLDPSEDMQRRGWKNEVEMSVAGRPNFVRCTYGYYGTIEGTIDIATGILTIDDIEFEGEGSGTLWNEVIEPALKQSTGKLQAVLVWEGGDTIESVVFEDGNLTRMDLVV